MTRVDKTISDYGYVSFEPIKDEWSVYCLEDKTIVKIKVVPLKFLRKGNDYPMNSMIATATFSPARLTGEPRAAPLPTPDGTPQELKDVDMRFDVLNEPWNEYRLDDGTTLFIRTIATSISSTHLYDAEGEPVYLVSHQVLTKRHPPI